MIVLILIVHLPVAYFTREANLSLGGFIRSLYDTGLISPYFHLWFLAHLLLYSAGYVVLRRYTERRPAKAARVWATPTHATIIWFTVALTLVTWIVRIVFPIDHWWPIFFVVASEPAHVPQYVGLFAIGAMAYRGDWLRRVSARTGRALFQRTNRFLLAMSAAAYAAYMLHLGLVIAIQGAILDVDASANSKFLFVAGLGIFLSFGLAYSARWVPGLRDLLGVAPTNTEKAGTEARS